MFKNTRIVVETIRISLALLGQSFREQACARVFARVLDLKFRVAIDAKVERKKKEFHYDVSTSKICVNQEMKKIISENTEHESFN